MSVVSNMLARFNGSNKPVRKVIRVDDAVEMDDPLAQSASGSAPAESTPEPRTRQVLVADIIKSLEGWNLAGFERAMKEYTRSLGNEVSADDLIPALIEDFGRQNFDVIVTLLARIANIADATAQDQSSLGYNVTTVFSVLVHTYVDKVLKSASVKRFDDSGNTTPVFDAYVNALMAYLFSLGKSEFSVDDRVLTVVGSMVASVEAHQSVLDWMQKAMKANMGNARYAYAVYLIGLSHDDVAESMGSNPEHFRQIAKFIKDLGESKQLHHVEMRKTLIEYVKGGDKDKCMKRLHGVAKNAKEAANAAIDAHKAKVAKLLLFVRVFRALFGIERREQAELERMQRVVNLVTRQVDAVIEPVLFFSDLVTSTHEDVTNQLQENEVWSVTANEHQSEVTPSEKMQELAENLHNASRQLNDFEKNKLFSGAKTADDFLSLVEQKVELDQIMTLYYIVSSFKLLSVIQGVNKDSVGRAFDVRHKGFDQKFRENTVAMYKWMKTLEDDGAESIVNKFVGLCKANSIVQFGQSPEVIAVRELANKLKTPGIKQPEELRPVQTEAPTIGA